ncbi:MAG: preprotein translocase subunit SecE [Gemmatimonadota bacterium]
MTMEKLQETKVFVEECVEELQKVTWPDWAQLKSATLVIIIFVLLISMVIWLMDVSVRFALDVIMGLFGA